MTTFKDGHRFCGLNDFICFVDYFEVNVKNAIHCKITLNALSGGERRKRDTKWKEKERERYREEECYVEVNFDWKCNSFEIHYKVQDVQVNVENEKI